MSVRLTRLGEKLVREIDNLSLEQLQRFCRDLADRIRRGRGVMLIVPKEIRLKFNVKIAPRAQGDLANLEWFWCRSCGYVARLANLTNGSNRRLVKCPVCKDSMEQAYVYAPRPRSTLLAPSTQVVAPISHSLRFFCRVLGRYKLIKRTNIMRPVASLRYYCPDPQEARRRRCQYLENNEECNEGGVFYPSRRTPTYLVGWTLTPLSEDLTKPLSIAVYEHGKEFEEIGQRTLEGVERILFFKDAKILEVTLCVLVGHSLCSRRRRIFIPYYDEEEDVYYLPSRMVRTTGLAIKVSNDVLKSRSTEERSTLLHTVSHAFLSRLPLATGLEADDFAEAIDTEEGEVLLYENARGGIGGIEGVLEGPEGRRELSANFEELVRSSVECPLECPTACRACLYSDSCYMLNWNLDRNLLIKAMGWS